MKERKNKIRKGKERDRTKDREKKKKQKRERQRKAGSPPLLSRALVTAETNYRLLRKAYEWAGTSDLSVIFFSFFFLANPILENEKYVLQGSIAHR